MRGEMDKVGCESWALDEPGAKKYALVAGVGLTEMTAGI
jgi:hypothetical protein